MSQPIALITGASRGIGKAIAKKLAKNNFKLALLARSKENLEEVANQLDLDPKNILTYDVDVTNQDNLTKAIDLVINKFNGIDCAFINHGIFEKSLFNSKPGNWRRVLDVNLLSAMQVTEYVLPYLTKSQSKYKSLIFTASVASHNRHAGGASYCTAKHGLLGFAHCIFDEVRETGLKVSALCPGFVNTDMINHDTVYGEKAIQPEDIAEIIFNTISLNATVCPVEIIIRPQFSPYK